MATLPGQVPTPDTTPASTGLAYFVDDPYGTPANNAATLANIVTKAHGLSDTTLLGVASGIIAAAATTGSGSAVLATSPTLVTPALGTPSSLNLTNATALPIATGVSGLGSNVATFLGTPSSANLAAAVTDETGTGALVFANSPTLVTPALGTPSSLNLTNATALPISGLTPSTVTAIGVGSIELGHASDTTISRASAGDIAVEGNAIYRAGGTDVPLTDGGTGGSTAAAARSNLGLTLNAGQLPIYSGQYFTPMRNPSVTSYNMVDERHYFLPCYLQEDMPIDRIGVTIITSAGGAGSIIRLGRYTANGAGRPDTLAIDYGTVAADAIASVEATVSDTLPRGFFFLAAVADIVSGTLTVRGVTNPPLQLPGSSVATSPGAQSNVAYIANGAGSGALLSPAGAPTSLSTSGIAIVVRAT